MGGGPHASGIPTVSDRDLARSVSGVYRTLSPCADGNDGSRPHTTRYGGPTATSPPTAQKIAPVATGIPLSHSLNLPPLRFADAPAQADSSDTWRPSGEPRPPSHPPHPRILDRGQRTLLESVDTRIQLRTGDRALEGPITAHEHPRCELRPH